MKDIIVEPSTKFDFKCNDYVAFKDREVCERLRKMSGVELEKHEDCDPKDPEEFRRNAGTIVFISDMNAPVESIYATYEER